MKKRQSVSGAGKFSGWHKCLGVLCKKCDSGNIQYRKWTSSMGDIFYNQFRCQTCGRFWWAGD